MTPSAPFWAVDAVRQWGRVASAYQTLTPLFRYWDGPGGSVVAYVQAHSRPGGQSIWVAAGEPIGPVDTVEKAARAFEQAAADAGARALWFGVERPERLGGSWTSLVIGAQPIWHVERWPAVMASKASLRAQVNRAKNKRVRVEEWSAEQASQSAPLRRVLDAWLNRRGLPVLTFLADPRVLDHLVDRRVFVAMGDDDGGPQPAGYLVLAPIPERDGWLVEWIIRSPASPNGTSALLLDSAVRSVQNSSMVTLGLVPLSTYAPLSEAEPSRAVRALIAWTRAHTRRFYNFKGLEHFKAKFLPDAWEPVYLVTDGRPVTLGTLYAVADAFSGPRGPVRLVGRALAGAVVDEARALRRRLSWPGR